LIPRQVVLNQRNLNRPIVQKLPQDRLRIHEIRNKLLPKSANAPAADAVTDAAPAAANEQQAVRYNRNGHLIRNLPPNRLQIHEIRNTEDYLFNIGIVT
jgi:hypothetical protein